ncbi:GTP-binding protein [Lachnospiraceae bacterium]|nr:GTP-binding protein [Lachnospiraceae bacterium]
MDNTSENKPVKYISVGLLAHVDAGKTTLSEALLYVGGSIRKFGRVDSRDAFLDTDERERARGITIFSKQAVLKLSNTIVTLLDTPGHVDFSAEMERTLQILDYAVLVISGSDGVQGHTRTLWQLLKKYEIPVFLFINKMDQPHTDKKHLMEELKEKLSQNCLDFSDMETEEFQENAAVCREDVLEYYLEHGEVTKEQIRELIFERSIFPCFFGSALKCSGIEEFLEALERFAIQPDYPQEFGAKVYKITRDGQGNRLTHLKVTGGSLKVKTSPAGTQEKINQIRIYSGEKFETAAEAQAGTVCAVTGLQDTSAGQGLGTEKDAPMPVLLPVLTCQVLLPDGCDTGKMLDNLRRLQEEEPELHIVWDEVLQEIRVQVMGEIQLEILKSLILERFGAEVSFGAGDILYKETIARPVEGVGHYEPLRHYAEVHLLLEPGTPGSGLQFDTTCSEDVLDRNWQRLVLTHLEEKEHKGVLTGAAITDMKITLITGRAHLKHTEGGDFRQATYRALRQGLMEAESVLLEPVYAFRLEIPEQMIGRAMTDVERMHGVFELPQTQGGMAVLTGTAPASKMQDYQQEVLQYTKGSGKLFCSLKGYEPCHNTQEVMEQKKYDPEGDLENTPDSVFCAHGAGFVVKWGQVKDYMQVETPVQVRRILEGKNESGPQVREDVQASGVKREQPESGLQEEQWIGEDEVEAILSRTFGANKHDKESARKGYHRRRPGYQEHTVSFTRTFQIPQKKEEYFLVDGYNMIFAWQELKELAEQNIDSARDRLLDIMCNYQGIQGCHLIVVFDAYRVQQHQTEILNYHNIHVVYTKEAETADQYIEKFAHEHAREYRVRVATSDGLEQIIIRGQGCGLVSAKELWKEIKYLERELKEGLKEGQRKGRYFLGDAIPQEVKGQILEE